MPTYEYACTTCGTHHEVVQSFHDDPLTTCPDCGGPVRKVFGAIGVVFKGSGFYKNDSRPPAKNGDSAKTAAETKPAEAAAGASKASGSPSESAPTPGNKSAPATSSAGSAKAATGTGSSAGSST